jgi:aryl-alcohol dehydrogenase-like predicted oxidoreductase
MELGCGLIAIGRPWGTTPEVPSEKASMQFLEAAYTLGIRFFDTAPAYGLSEQRLGLFLKHLTTDERKEVTVATKFGEHWDKATNESAVDHSLDGLKRSLDTSLSLLGQISILQLHKTRPESFHDTGITDAFTYAASLGINHFGVSISDIDSAALALTDDRFDYLQLPYNKASVSMRPVVQQAAVAHKRLIINRPFQMGKIAVNTHQDPSALAIDAYRFVVHEARDGVVLTGTSNSGHLADNIRNFQAAVDAEHLA